MLMDILSQVDYKQWQDTSKHCRAFIISDHTFDIIAKDDFTMSKWYRLASYLPQISHGVNQFTLLDKVIQNWNYSGVCQKQTDPNTNSGTKPTNGQAVKALKSIQSWHMGQEHICRKNKFRICQLAGTP